MISFKECWPDAAGDWYSTGGFPLQMEAIGSLFDEAVLMIVEGAPQAGGIPLPRHFRVVPLARPKGRAWRRKLYVLLRLAPYVVRMGREVLRADVVHVPPPGDLPFLGMVTALALRKKLIARYCGSWQSNPRTTFMNRVTRYLMRAFAGGRNVMLATGVGDALPGRNMHWMFATALRRQEVADLRPDLDRGLSIPPRLVFVGRLVDGKGVDILLRALAILRGQRYVPLPCLHVAGDGPERGALESLARELGIADVVQFEGQLDRPALSRLLLQADVCVQPSVSEGFSKAWLDAFAHGVPVLSSRVGAAVELIGEAGERGWLLDAVEPGTLAARLAEILAVPAKEWPALRRRCRDAVADLTLEEWASRIGQIAARQWGCSLEGGRLR